MAIEPRRESNLDKYDDLFVNDDEPEEESRVDQLDDPDADEKPQSDEKPDPIEVEKPRKPSRRRRSRGLPPPPITRNARRVIARGPVSDDDLVSFNCKMTRGLRRSVKKYAADVEVDIQDVVAAALEDYLDERGIPFPGSDQHQPD